MKKLRSKNQPRLTREEVLARMAAGESLRTGSARAFALWGLGNREVSVLGDEILADVGGVDHDWVISELWLDGAIKIDEHHDEVPGIDFYRLATDSERKARRTHIDRFGVLDLDAEDRRPSARARH